MRPPQSPPNQPRPEPLVGPDGAPDRQDGAHEHGRGQGRPRRQPPRVEDRPHHCGSRSREIEMGARHGKDRGGVRWREIGTHRNRETQTAATHKQRTNQRTNQQTDGQGQTAPRRRLTPDDGTAGEARRRSLELARPVDGGVTRVSGAAAGHGQGRARSDGGRMGWPRFWISGVFGTESWIPADFRSVSSNAYSMHSNNRTITIWEFLAQIRQMYSFAPPTADKSGCQRLLCIL